MSSSLSTPPSNVNAMLSPRTGSSADRYSMVRSRALEIKASLFLHLAYDRLHRDSPASTNPPTGAQRSLYVGFTRSIWPSELEKIAATPIHFLGIVLKYSSGGTQGIGVLCRRVADRGVVGVMVNHSAPYSCVVALFLRVDASRDACDHALSAALWTLPRGCAHIPVTVAKAACNL